MQKKLWLFVLVLFASGIALAENVTLQWDANTEPDLAGYKIYYKAGDVSGAPYNGVGAMLNGVPAPSPVDVGNVTEVTLDMPDDSKFIFTATAYDNESPRLESDYSNEVVWSPSYMGKPPEPPKSLLEKILESVSGWFKGLFKKLRVS